MFLKRKVFITFVFILLFFPLVTWADGPKIESFQLHEQTDDITFNPLTGDDSRLLIRVTADREVKFTTISICKEDDSICNRTSAFKYFSSSTFSLTAEKEWNGKNSKDENAPNGIYRVKVTMKDGEGFSVEEFITAKIVINSSASALSNLGNDDNDADDDNNSDFDLGNDSNLSAHSGQVEISSYDPDDIEISAGRARLANTRTPVEFKVESQKPLSGTFEWSFGDGTSKRGVKVSHQYDFPGQYNVVLNYTSGLEEAVSRTVVTVTEPNFVLEVFPDKNYLSIKNLGEWEENINDWNIKNGSSTIITFVKDTIVSAGGELKISLPKETKTGSWSLNCPDDFTVAGAGTKIANQDQLVLFASTTAKVIELRQKLAEAQNMLIQIKKEQALTLAAVGSADLSQLNSGNEQDLESETDGISSNSTTSDIIIIEKKAGMITKILKAVKKIF
ncbi:MAG: PKD domain-containing protein [Candidatus Paceibacterota bacterium]